MIRDIVPLSRGCLECEAAGLRWKQLRLCTACGYVGCCETSEGRHALGHYNESHHPVIRSFEPGEDWLWCYVDETYIGRPTGTRNWQASEEAFDFARSVGGYNAGDLFFAVLRRELRGP